MSNSIEFISYKCNGCDIQEALYSERGCPIRDGELYCRSCLKKRGYDMAWWVQVEISRGNKDHLLSCKLVKVADI